MIETVSSTSKWELGALDFAWDSGLGMGLTIGRAAMVVETDAGSGAQVLDHDLSNRFG